MGVVSWRHCFFGVVVWNWLSNWCFFGFGFELLRGVINWCEDEYVNFGEEGEDEGECKEILIRWWLIARQHVVKIWDSSVDCARL